MSESLAGRVGFVELGGFDLTEVGTRNTRKLWLRGGLPRSYLARSHSLSLRWRRDFVRTFLERDVPQLGIRISAESLRRFWLMLAHYHAQIWNGAELARSIGVGEHTVCRYHDVLAGAYRVRQLPPSSCLNPRCAHMPRSIGYGTCWRAIILIASWPGGPKWLKYSSATWIPTW